MFFGNFGIVWKIKTQGSWSLYVQSTFKLHGVVMKCTLTTSYMSVPFFRKKQHAASLRRIAFRHNILLHSQRYVMAMHNRCAMLMMLTAGAFTEGFWVNRQIWCEFWDCTFWENQVPTINNKRFLSKFQRATFDHIVEQLTPRLHRQDTNMRKAIPVPNVL